MAKTTKPAARKPAAKKPAVKKPTARSASRTAGATAASAARKTEFDAIQKKAKALSAKLSNSDFDAAGNPTGPWAAMLAELDAWAKKYSVKLRTTEHVSGGGVPGEPVPRARSSCPGSISETERTDFVGGGYIIIKTTCTLRRQTILTGRCVFSCVGEILDWQV